MLEPALGVDFGGVIAEAASDIGGHPSTRPPSEVPPVNGALDAVRELREVFAGRVWVVSKASPSTEAWTRQWMRTHGFCEVTSIDTWRLRFVRERSGKRGICRELGITHFIDDRLENLEILIGAVPHLYLFGAASGLPGIEAVAGWAEARERLRQSVGDQSAVQPNSYEASADCRREDH